MNLLIIIPRQPHTTGNHVSASRFALSLSHRGWQIRIIEVAENEPAPILEALQSPPDIVLLLHAYRSGKPWLLSQAQFDIPYAVLLTGTDLNRDLNNPERALIINRTLTGASAVIVQNPIAFSGLQETNNPWIAKLKLLPPGIVLGAAGYPLRSNLGLSAEDLLMLHPGSLRPVKGSLELAKMARGLLKCTPNLHLAFCGPVLDTEYAAQFFAALQMQPRTYYLGEIPYAAMPDVLLQSDLILNNSTSEGVPNALVEAASLGRPILARNIPGNASVVRPEDNGLVFDDDLDFERQALRLITEPTLRQRLSRPDLLSFSAEIEGERLGDLLEEVLRGAAD
ncbi:GPMC system family 4 glycosyltransferase [Geopsychrobacter electrodiphilus]|uniref:GPMC system family 4 glycosyltransferase n=1 Tax=Geopsychrobacter electrodiphilus TaxID=225196 RepID=UPI00037DB341|nr:GPMC system family 4 glycosyltransferase [Geopsychrobacter electrodiphilus]